MADRERIIPAAAREPSDVGPRFILGAAAAVLGALGCVILGVRLGFPDAVRDRTVPATLPAFPQPALQASPRTDMARFRAAELRQLEGTGWVDRAHGVVHIPIADAMALTARDGIPDWPSR